MDEAAVESTMSIVCMVLKIRVQLMRLRMRRTCAYRWQTQEDGRWKNTAKRITMPNAAFHERHLQLMLSECEELLRVHGRLPTPPALPRPPWAPRVRHALSRSP